MHSLNNRIVKKRSYLILLFFFPLLVLAKPMETVNKSIPEQIRLFEKKLAIHPNDLNTVEALIELYLYQPNYERAEDLIDKYLQKSNLTPITRAKCWLWKAEYLKFNNKVEEAFFYYMKSREVFIQEQDWNLLVFCNARVMEFYRKTAKHEMGISLAKETEKIIHRRKVIDLKALNLFYNRYAALVNEQNQPAFSLKLSNKALSFADLLNDNNAKAISYNEMGFSYKNSNQVALAIKQYQKAEKEWRIKGYLREALNAEFNIITMKAHNNLINVESQIVAFKALLAKANALSIHDHDGVLYHYISTCYQFSGDTKNELKYYRLSVKEDLELMNRQNEIKLKNAEEKYQNDQLNKKLVDEKKQKAFQQKQNIQNRKTIWLFVVLAAVFLIGLIYSIVLQQKVKKSYQEIKLKDEQKNTLIAEIHHRVKNNLQYVRSILEMQLAIVSEEKDKHNLEDVSRRIQAMTLVHEMLYNKEESIGINIEAYLNQLVQHLSIGFSSKNQPEVQINITSAEVTISEATSLGIVCAELFNNSVKYAFINHPNPLFIIDLKITADKVNLLVKDNGENFAHPNNLQDENRQKLGLRIIDIFARQLKAVYQIEKDHGYKFELSYTRSKLV